MKSKQTRYVISPIEGEVKILKSFFGYKGNYIQCDDNLKSQFKYNTAAFVISRNF